jgi:peptide/nickel transport system substrate-binding protein
MVSRTRCATALAVLSLLVTSACNAGSGTSATGAKTTAVAKDGGDATFLFPTAPLDLDPSTSQDNNVSMPMMNAWFEYLIQQKQGSSDYQPMLASSWEVSPDQLTYSFHLNSAAKFSDGSPLTSGDVVASLKRNLEPDISLLNFLNAKISSMTAPDETTVKIALSKPWPHLLADLASPTAAIYSQKALAAAESPKAFFNTKPMGTGPFVLSDVVTNSRYTVKKNPSYWDASGAPHLDSITFSVVTDETARVTAVLGQRADIAQSPPANQLKALQSNSAVSVGSFPSARVQLIALNTKKPPFDNLKLRQAFSLALDRKAIVEAGLFGAGSPATTFLVPPPEMAFQNPKLDLYPTDAAKARQLVQESGVPTPIEIPLEVSTGSAEDAILIIAKDNRDAIGFKVSPTRKDAASVDNDIIGQKYTANTTFWGNLSGDPSIQPLFAVDPDYCCDAYFTGYHDAGLVALLHRAINTADRAQAQTMFDEVQRKVAEAAFLVPLYYPDLTYVLSPKITGFKADPYGFYDWAAIGFTR